MPINTSFEPDRDNSGVLTIFLTSIVLITNFGLISSQAIAGLPGEVSFQGYPIFTQDPRWFSQQAYAADINGDGNLDAISCSVSGPVRWFESTGGATPTFTAYLIDNNPDCRAVFVADVDSDDDMDLLSASAIGNGEVRWYENDGAASPSFTSHVVATTGIDFFALWADDVDGDGDMDLITGNGPSGPSSNQVAWHENIGGTPPTFIEHELSRNTNWPHTIRTVDLDGDKDLDIVAGAGDPVDGNVVWYENDGATPPSFTQWLIGSQGVNAWGIDTADVNGDGYIDVLVASESAGTLWYENSGATDPDFSEHPIIGTDTRSVSVADIDGDGDLDVFAAQLNWDSFNQRFGKFVWHENHGGSDPNFEEHLIGTVSTGGFGAVVVAGDFDDNGNMDVLAQEAGIPDARLLWYENQTDGMADISATIDIKPGNKQNAINPRAKGGIWVAILSETNTASPFDPVSQVDIPTVEFGPDGAKAIRYKVKDQNKDGLGDLLMRFRIPETGITCSDTDVTLSGKTFDGHTYTGTDSIKTAGCKKAEKK